MRDTYTLTAEHHGKRYVRPIYGDDSTDATIGAVMEIMSLAYEDKEGPWAKGRILLLDPEGEVLHEMPAK